MTNRPPESRLDHRRTLLVAGVVFVLTFLSCRIHDSPSNFNPDESRWISRAYFVSALQHPLGPSWQDSYRMRGQPPIGSYVTGLGLLVQGRDLSTNEPWNFTWKWEDNLARGRKPEPGDLHSARRTSAVLVSLAAVIVLFTARMVTSPVGAMAAALVFAVHPFSVYIGSLATADASFLLFVVLAAYLAGRLARHPGPWPALALGVAIGLGTGTKLSPLPAAIPLAAYGGLLLVIDLWRTRRVPRDWLGWGLVCAPAVAAAVFVGTYPYLWPDPVGRTLNLVRFRTREMQLQATDWPVMAVSTRAEAFRRIGENFHERYSLLQVTRLANLELPAIELSLAAAGAVVWLADAVRAGLRSPIMVILITLGSQVAVTVAGMRSEFDRYHVPMLAFGCIAIGAAVGSGVEFLNRQLLAGNAHRHLEIATTVTTGE